MIIGTRFQVKLLIKHEARLSALPKNKTHTPECGII